jgi:hypothetical protein
MRWLVATVLFAFASITASYALADGNWKGVDETVIEKYAGERGMQKKSLINLEGDTQLFAFLAAGAAGGFAAGYFFRDLKGKKRK